MRTLTAELLAELALSVTRPGYLIELGFSTPLHLSTMGTIAWGAHTWIAADAKVSGIAQDGSSAANAALALGNTDNAYGALILNEGASDIAVTIYACYAGATASGDAVQVFEGVSNGADIDERAVKLALTAQANKTLYSPRVFISKASGFNFLQPAGTKIFANGEAFVLERAR